MSLKQLDPKTLPRDILTGVIIALVSIPISMGYSQIAGLPAVYGLYGSIFPILIFGLMSGSKQFIFGVDAAPAALVGAELAVLGIESGSREAVQTVPMITLFVAAWLMIFRLLRAGRLVNYISTPVMGGFISGISTTIIFMQIPKLLGGSSGTGELPELIVHIAETIRDSFNGVSLLMGAVSLALLLTAKKLAPKLPMSVAVMAAGAALGYFGIAERYDVACLSRIERGLPAWQLPSISPELITDLLPVSLTVAVVIMAETLLASNSLANKNGYRLDNDREILVYSIGNLAAALTGCCPVNGSVSRSSMGEQYGGKSQVMSLTASAAMIVIMLFCTGFIQYLPVPVLTAIVISALHGAVEFDLIERLYHQDRKELLIFFAAFFGVLIFGTIFGVTVGVILSFVSIIIRTANPKRSFLGVIPGHEGFHSLERNTNSIPIKGVVLYRFSGNLYFANIGLFVDDIERSLKPETRCVIVDSGAICNIDITAADRISQLSASLAEKGIGLYLASHIGSLNDRLRQLGLGGMIEQGRCRRTIIAALTEAGFSEPYELEENELLQKSEVLSAGRNDRLEFEWAFGADADEQMEKYTERLLSGLDGGEDIAEVIKPEGEWKGMGELDQEELLVHLEAHLKELSERLRVDEQKVGEVIELRRMRLALKLRRSDPKALERIREHNRRFEQRLKEKHPDRYETLMTRRRQAISHIRESDPQYAELIEKMYS